ncbi:TIGR01777 family oxidoreductase [Actinoplanes bogorensis]|uniref:TIGR01777 family oxidoreductase n=1 Tax=Paractinoplanes bogorensis TaxID=1610840 RepID=A0ABS5Z867_9ACTN|nr:TIGR01777 family oxidoreductase [Actinoplanes bogorensis]MBU2670680.1 TIGR01777 family oxidoreductase [Actinoplanes bogorensis]
MRILISGGSGFLGAPLVERLRGSGHDVTRLVRRPAQKPDEASWQPAQGQLDPHLVAAADVVINLSGANVGAKRWTAGYKSELRSSRVDTTGTIARAISKLPEADRPRTLLQASAVGWYGDTGDNPVTEEAPAGSTFLADLCRVWEAAARPAEDAGVRVVLLRTGIAVETLVERLLLVFKLGGGAKLGGGKQWMPWSTAPDWLGAAEFLLEREDISGPVNIVGAQPATNNEFTKAFADAVHRPALLSVPSPALHLVLGELAGESLRSTRVVPGVLERSGFRWTHPTIESALQAAVGQQPAASR